MRFVTILIIIFSSTTAYSKANNCTVPGEPTHWIADYCLYEAETDDFHSESVQSCYNSQNNQDLNPCEIKKKYKTKVCKRLAHYFDDSWEKCFNSDFSGSTVRNGGIGN